MYHALSSRSSGVKKNESQTYRPLSIFLNFDSESTHTFTPNARACNLGVCLISFPKTLASPVTSLIIPALAICIAATLEAGMLILVLVLKDIFQVLVLVLVLEGQVLVLVFGGQVLVLVLVLGGQVLVLVLEGQVLVLVLVLVGQVLVLVLVLGGQVLVNIPGNDT